MVARSHEVLQEIVFIMSSEIVCDITVDLEHISKAVDAIIPLLKSNTILLLKGDLGSGKTTFSKSLLKSLGVEIEVSSPTFNIIHVYNLKDGSTVNHLDLYRIKDESELEEFGFYEYIDSNSICLIEWPEIAESSIPLPYLCLNIHYKDDKRRYVLEKIEQSNN